MSARQTQSRVVPVESPAARSPFDAVADRHQWAPGAREMALRDYRGYVRIRHAYALMVRELALPEHFGREKCIARYRSND